MLYVINGLSKNCPEKIVADPWKSESDLDIFGGPIFFLLRFTPLILSATLGCELLFFRGEGGLIFAKTRPRSSPPPQLRRTSRIPGVARRPWLDPLIPAMTLPLRHKMSHSYMKWAFHSRQSQPTRVHLSENRLPDHAQKVPIRTRKDHVGPPRPAMDLLGPP